MYVFEVLLVHNFLISFFLLPWKWHSHLTVPNCRIRTAPRRNRKKKNLKFSRQIEQFFFAVYDTQHKLMFSPESALIAVGIRFGC